MAGNAENPGKSSFIRNIVKEDAPISDYLKYSILQKACALVHLSFIFIFWYVNITPMAIFNIVSTGIYLICGLLVKNEEYTTVYYITFIEVCVHAYAATILCGWASGFALYIIAITPVVFYMHFSLNANSMKETFVVGICAAAAFIVCRILCWEIPRKYILSENAEVLLYIYNAFYTFLMIIFFSMMFMREMKASHDEMEEENAKLDRIASLDALTGLYNRRSMDTFLKKADVSGRTFSMIMCDIDDFKKVNDTYGHDAGDVVLKNVSKTIVSSLRDGDYVCRWGGEEILILATNTPLFNAALAAERIRKAVEKCDNISDGVNIKCTVTIGAAESSEANNISDVINLADERLYKGKKSGKNMVVSD